MAMSDLLGLHAPREQKGSNEPTPNRRKIGLGRMDWINKFGRILIHHSNNSLVTQSVKIRAHRIDLWRMSYFSKSTKGDMVANQCRHNGWAVPGGIWSWPLSDPSLMRVSNGRPVDSEGVQEEP